MKCLICYYSLIFVNWLVLENGLWLFDRGWLFKKIIKKFLLGL